MNRYSRDSLSVIRAFVRISIVPFALQMTLPVSGQTGWQPCGADTCFIGGKVGIGTTTPRSALPGWPSLDLGPGGLFFGNYNVGGVSFASISTWPANGGLIAWNRMNYAGETSLINFSGGAGNDGGFSFWDRDAFLMRITKGGNVGIGTSTPSHMLHVAGTIGAKEVIVSATGADYVFSPDYRLQPLKEVRKYISQHRHLPDIPSEGEIRKKGVSVGDMQTKLLAKVEELTLHMIRADEINSRLKDQNRELRERVSRLELLVSTKAK